MYSYHLHLRPLTLKTFSAIHTHHGRRSRGDRGTSPPPQNLEWEDANANCPPAQILSYRYKNERSVAFKIRQNPFSAGPGPRWGSSRRSPRPLSRLERGHPSPYAIPLDTDPPSALAMRPPRIPADLRLSQSQSQ